MNASESFLYLSNKVLYIPLSCVKEYRCLKNVIYQIESKYEWFSFQQILLSKFGLFFFVTLEIFFGGRVKEWMVFILKPTKSIGSSKYGTRNLQNITPYERSARFYVTITGNFERFQYFNFETNFLENANSFPKTGEQNISIQNCHIRIQCLDK